MQIPIVRSDVVGLMRSKASMYLGDRPATSAVLAPMIISDILTLGLTNVAVEVVRRWTIISADGDWTRMGKASDLARSALFRTLSAFDEAGPNATRHEPYLTAFARDVFVMSASYLEVIQGEAPPDEIVNNLREGWTHVGFTVAT